MNIGVMRMNLPQYLFIYFNLFLQLNFGAGDIRFLVYTLFLQIATAREYAAAESSLVPNALRFLYSALTHRHILSRRTSVVRRRSVGKLTPLVFFL